VLRLIGRPILAKVAAMAFAKKAGGIGRGRFATAVGFCYSPSAINDGSVPW
jgi:hypothetical protein